MTPHPDPSFTSYNRGCRCAGCREAHRLYMKAWRQSRKPSEVERSADAPSDAGRGGTSPSLPPRPATKSKFRTSDSFLANTAKAPKPPTVDDDRTCCHCLTTFPSRTARKKHQCVPFTKTKPRYDPQPEVVQVVVRHPRWFAA